MTRVLSFGAYLFDDVGVDFSTNFADLVPRTVRLPGLDGGYDEFGSDRAPGEIGSIRFSFWLQASTPAEMQGKRDALRRMADWGVQALTVEPEPGVAERWCFCRVQNMQLPEQFAQRTRLNQRVTITFQASTPRWYAASAESPYEAEAMGDEDSFALAVGGSATALPVITVLANTTLAGGIAVRLERNASTVDRVVFGDPVPSGDTLVIDCRALRVTLEGANAYSTDFTVDHPAWLRLAPGVETTVVVELGGGEDVDVTVEFDDTWY